MDDLVQWLREQLDEDEQITRAAADETEPEWSDGGPYGESVHTAAHGGLVAVGPWTGYLGDEVRRHIARHDPARVLREIDAKRKLLRALESSEVALRNTEPGKDPHDLVKGATNGLRAAVRVHAAVYADRPGYKESWRP